VYTTSDFRKGLKIELDGKPYIIVDFLHVKPGKGGAFVRTKIKNLISGQVLDKTFRASERVEKPDLSEREMQYLYKDGDNYCMMDKETYDQVLLNAPQIGDGKNYLKENTDVKVLLFNDNPIGLELPNFVGLAIVETEPGVRGDTASGGSKPATLETGAVIQVPLFLNEGDIVRVDTRTGEYIERVKAG
jgi:elongation factor P